MKLITYPLLLTIIGLAGCAGVDPSTANRERPRETASTTQSMCASLEAQTPVPPTIRPPCPT